jgi:Major Facilitator Superfamily
MSVDTKTPFASGTGDPAAIGTNPWLIAVIVSVATFMEVLDTTIANVALRYISGGLTIGPSQAAWVVTSYLVANSIALCASSWLSGAFERRNFFLTCIALFTVCSILRGFAQDLTYLSSAAGTCGRRYDTGGSVHSGGRFPSQRAQSGLCDLWRSSGGGPRDRPRSGRVAQQQLVLELLLFHKRTRWPRVTGSGLFSH